MIPNSDFDTLPQPGFAASPGTFYVVEGNRILKIGDNPAQLAAETKSGLDPVAILEDMAIGFQLGNRTVFNSVKRLLPWQRLIRRNEQVVVEESSLKQPQMSVTESLAETTCEAFKAGAALELTGGLDSRLLLALGLARDVKPHISFTIGDQNSADVIIAAKIATAFKIPHLNIPVVINHERISNDALTFVRASGYSVDASAYGWLPGTLRLLDDKRSAQVSGAGGEVVGGFYYTPCDSIVGPLRLDRLWTKLRLCRPWISFGNVLKPETARGCQIAMANDIATALGSPETPWRLRVDKFYRDERIRRWAIPVLDASRKYYTVIAPYISGSYFSWAESLPIRQRAGRKAQYQLLQTIHEGLCSFAGKNHVSSITKFARMLQKVQNRTLPTRTRSALGSQNSAGALIGDRRIHEMVWRAVEESQVGFRKQRIKDILSNPSTNPELVGVLVNIAVAWHDKRSYE